MNLRNRWRLATHRERGATRQASGPTTERNEVLISDAGANESTEELALPE
ncbi:hypothetical protein [Haladaptatus sp. DFWS20]